MAETHGEAELEFIETKFSKILKNPEIFYKPQPENTCNIKQVCQKSYKGAVCDELFKGKSLSKLLIDGFDEEQIWQQSDLLNKASLSNLSDFIHNFDSKDFSSVLNTSSLSNSSLNKRDSKTSTHKQKKKSIDTNEDAGSISSQESSAEDYAFDDDSDSTADFDPKLKRDNLPQKITGDVSEDDSDSPSDLNIKPDKHQSPHKESEDASNFNDGSNSSFEFDPKSKKKQLAQKKSKYTSIVDDQFFKLSSLENFLRIEDLKEERGEDSASEADIDLFQDIPSDTADVDGDSGEEQDKKSARNMMYGDFFDDPESELENNNNNTLNDKDESLMEENDEYSLDESEPDDKMENAEKEGDQQNKFPPNSMNSEDKKTKFELEQERIKKKIQEYEKSMLEPLPWHLTGEVAAEKRPVDSLLEQEADFDCNTKQDLLVDKDLTKKIEEITIMAIRNKAFFDVERKYKPTGDVINYKKEVAIEQTKSKKSLAEVYEEDYLKKQFKQNAEEEEENPKHKEIKKLMDTLLPQLHALFSHIPKPAVPEIKIVSNLPAITVEEVAPTNVSDATLLAPEEVKKKTGLVKGKTERTDTDRKRERRKKKIHQRLKEKKKLEKLESQKENPSAKVSKLEKIQTLKKLKQHKNTKIAAVDESGKIKSSKDFFSRLQDTVDIKNKNKRSSKKVKNK